MQEALWKIRTTLGEGAEIVGTRTFRRGGLFGVGAREVVEVYVTDQVKDSQALAVAAEQKTSRLENTESPPESNRTSRVPGQGREVDHLSQALGSLRQEIHDLAANKGKSFDHPFLTSAYELLVSYDVDAKLAEQLVWDLKSVQLPVGVVPTDRVRAMVKAQLKKLFPPNVPTAMEGDRKVLILVGATGVGKTTTIAKLAARAKINERKSVGLITLDTFRIAAVDQLQKYANIIGVPVEVVADPAEYKAAIKRFKRSGVQLTLVDTAGRGQRDELKMQELREFLDITPNAEIHLVLSTIIHPRTLKNVVTRFVPLGVHRLILTKLDETDSFGSLVKPLASINKPVSFVTDGQNVPDDIMVSDPDRLASLVFRASQF